MLKFIPMVIWGITLVIWLKSKKTSKEQKIIFSLAVFNIFILLLLKF